MKRFQFDNITTPSRVMITSGSSKGTICNAVSRYGSEIVVEPPIGDKFHIHYTKLEFVDENDNIVLSPVTDTTDRELFVGDHIVYSVNAGESSHALEIGKIISISPTGAPTVERILHNGKPARATWRNKNTRTVTDPDRCIKLPIDTSTLMMWMFKDFKDFGSDD